MPSNEYHFITNWRVPATIEEVFDILSDAKSLTRWWPSVYLDVKVLNEGDENTGIGREIGLFTKGWLPYTLKWDFTVTEVQHPTRMSLKARGDFDGRGIWTLKQDGEIADITYDWKINADKPMLKNLSLIMKPLFSANHHWAMDMGEKSLLLELARRRATTPDELAAIPAPPKATFR